MQFVYGISLLLAAVVAAGASEVESDVAAAPAADAAEAGEVTSALGYLERTGFTTAVSEREPQDSVAALSNDHVQVSYFTEARDLGGEQITHRWEHDGKVMAEVPFDIGGTRWRFHSTKKLDPSWVGEWTVSVVDSSGQVLHSDTFTYEEIGTSGKSSTVTEADDAAVAESAGTPVPPDDPATPAAPDF